MSKRSDLLKHRRQAASLFYKGLKTLGNGARGREMDKGNNFMTLSETWQMRLRVGVGKERSLGQNRRSHAPKWPQSAWWMQDEHCWRGRDLIWKLHPSYFLLHGIQGDFLDVGQKARNATWHTGGFLTWRSWSAFNNSATWLLFQRRQFGWCFKQMKKGIVFCKVNCFCGTQIKWDLILALLGILKISN